MLEESMPLGLVGRVVSPVPVPTGLSAVYWYGGSISSVQVGSAKVCSMTANLSACVSFEIQYRHGQSKRSMFLSLY